VRAIVLLIGIVAGLAITFPHPFVGVLLWAWFALQNPHQEAYGAIQSLPLNFVIAAVTVGALLFSRERKLPTLGTIPVLLLVFVAWITFNSFFAFSPSWSWPIWSRTWKIFAFGLIVAATATDRKRLYALTWACVVALFYYGVKGGLFTIATGGNFHVYGPPGTIIGDNNQLAVALLMTLPLANYLRGEVSNKIVALALTCGSLLTVVAVLGTYSRGAFIGLGVLAFLALLRTRNRFLYLGLIAILCVFALNFMPSGFFDRMHSIGKAQDDSSFTGRVFAWRVAVNYAADHFPFGAGFYGPQLAGVFHAYFPNEFIHAAHSIYFQVLGEHGFIGDAIYLKLIGAGFLKCSQIIRRARKIPHLAWARDLGIALQASLLVFCVSGAALSMAYYDLFIIELAMLLPLEEIVKASGTKRRSSPWGETPAKSPSEPWHGEHAPGAILLAEES
jgi:putative inorganic carbon (HCO3(-)) transporter